MKEQLSRRDFLKILGVATAAPVLAACGPGPEGISAGSSSSQQNSGESQAEVCVQSYPGASVLGIVGDPNAQVRIDQGNNGTIDYQGPAVNAPGLQYNEGARDLNGNQINPTIVDNVCYIK